MEPIKPLTTLDLPILGEDVPDYSGEQIRIPRLEVPEIRVSYKAEDDPEKVVPRGQFVEYDPATKKTRALGAKVKNIQIIHHRQQISLTTDTDSYRGFEISMKTKEYQLFLFTKDASGKNKTQFMGSGTLNQLRNSSPALAKLRYERCVYILHENKLKKLNVYGASFSQFIEFTKVIKGQSSTSVQIDLTTGKEKKGINIYYPIIFTPKEKSDLKALQPIMKQLSDWFDKYDSRIASQQKERAEQSANDRGDGSTAIAKDKFPPLVPSEEEHKTMAEEVQHGDEEDRTAITDEALSNLGI